MNSIRSKTNCLVTPDNNQRLIPITDTCFDQGVTVICEFHRRSTFDSAIESQSLS